MKWESGADWDHPQEIWTMADRMTITAADVSNELWEPVLRLDSNLHGASDIKDTILWDAIHRKMGLG